MPRASFWKRPPVPSGSGTGRAAIPAQDPFLAQPDPIEFWEVEGGEGGEGGRSAPPPPPPPPPPILPPLSPDPGYTEPEILPSGAVPPPSSPTAPSAAPPPSPPSSPPPAPDQPSPPSPLPPSPALAAPGAGDMAGEAGEGAVAAIPAYPLAQPDPLTPEEVGRLGGHPVDEHPVDQDALVDAALRRGAARMQDRVDREIEGQVQAERDRVSRELELKREADRAEAYRSLEERTERLLQQAREEAAADGREISAYDADVFRGEYLSNGRAYIDQQIARLFAEQQQDLLSWVQQATDAARSGARGESASLTSSLRRLLARDTFLPSPDALYQSWLDKDINRDDLSGDRFYSNLLPRPVRRGHPVSGDDPAPPISKSIYVPGASEESWLSPLPPELRAELEPLLLPPPSTPRVPPPPRDRALTSRVSLRPPEALEFIGTVAQLSPGAAQGLFSSWMALEEALSPMAPVGQAWETMRHALGGLATIGFHSSLAASVLEFPTGQLPFGLSPPASRYAPTPSPRSRKAMEESRKLLSAALSILPNDAGPSDLLSALVAFGKASYESPVISIPFWTGMLTEALDITNLIGLGEVASAFRGTRRIVELAGLAAREGGGILLTSRGLNYLASHAPSLGIPPSLRRALANEAARINGLPPVEHTDDLLRRATDDWRMGRAYLAPDGKYHLRDGGEGGRDIISPWDDHARRWFSSEEDLAESARFLSSSTPPIFPLGRTAGEVRALRPELLEQEALTLPPFALLAPGESRLTRGSITLLMDPLPSSSRLRAGDILYDGAASSARRPSVFASQADLAAYYKQFNTDEAAHRALSSQGYDSIYVPSSRGNEGMLVVFDRSKVRLSSPQTMTPAIIAEIAARRKALEEIGPELRRMRKEAEEIIREAPSPAVLASRLAARGTEEQGTFRLPGEGLPPRPRDNYITRLSEYTGRLYRETSLQDLEKFLPTRRYTVSMENEDIFFANTIDLALGQGANRGVLLEFDSLGLRGRINTTKPGWDFSWDNGSAEFIGKHNHQGQYQAALREVTIFPGARGDKVTGARLKSVLPHLESMGWRKQELPDGSTRYTRPDRSGTGEEQGAFRLPGESPGPNPAEEAAARLRIKPANLRSAEAELKKLESRRIDVSGAREKLDDYNGIERGDFDSGPDGAQEYREAREEAYQEFLDELEGTEIEEAAEVVTRRKPATARPSMFGSSDDQPLRTREQELDRLKMVQSGVATDLLTHQQRGTDPPEHLRSLLATLQGQIDYLTVEKPGTSHTFPEWARLYEKIGKSSAEEMGAFRLPGFGPSHSTPSVGTPSVGTPSDPSSPWSRHVAMQEAADHALAFPGFDGPAFLYDPRTKAEELLTDRFALLYKSVDLWRRRNPGTDLPFAFNTEILISAWYGRHAAGIPVVQQLLRDVQSIYRPLIKSAPTGRPGPWPESTVRHNLATYLDLNHAIDIERALGPQRRIPGGIAGASEAQAALDTLRADLGPSRWAAVEEMGRKVVQAGDTSLQHLVDEGLVSSDLALELRLRYPHYAPIAIVETINDSLKGGVAFSVRDDTLRRLTEFGTEKAKIHPLETTVAAVLKREEVIAANRVARSIGKVNVELGIGEEVGTALRNYSTDKFGTIAYFEGGQKHIVKLPIEIVRVATEITGSSPEGAITGILQALYNIQRAGAITYNPGFFAFNVLRDLLTVIFTERPNLKQLAQGMIMAAENSISHSPAFDRLVSNGFLTEGFYARDPHEVMLEVQRRSGRVFRSGNLLMEWLRRGFPEREGTFWRAGMRRGRAVAAMRGEQHPERLEEIWARAEMTLARGLFVGGYPATKTLFETGQLMRGVGGALENGVRAAGAIARLKKLGVKVDSRWGIPRGFSGPDLEEALKIAAHAGQRSTIQFARGGVITKALNPLLFMLNAQAQGLLTPLRALAGKASLEPGNDASTRRAWTTMAGVTGAYLALYLHNSQYPEYDDLPPFLKYNPFLFMMESGTMDPITGRVSAYPVVVMPGSSAAAPFTSVLGYLLDSMRQDHPEDFSVFARHWLKFSLPLSDPADVVSLQPVKAFLEATANYDFFRDRPLVPPDKQNLPPADQYDRYTMEVFKRLGLLTGYSPMVLQHLATSLWAGGGRALTGILDYGYRTLRPPRVDEKAQRDVDGYLAIPPTDGAAREDYLKKFTSKQQQAIRELASLLPPSPPILGDISRRFFPESRGELSRQAQRDLEEQFGRRFTAQQTREFTQALVHVMGSEHDKQLELTERLRSGVISWKEFGDELSDMGAGYRGILAELQSEFPLAAQNDPKVWLAWQLQVASEAERLRDPNVRGRVLLAAWRSMQMPEDERGMPDFDRFTQMREDFRAVLPDRDKELLEKWRTAGTLDEILERERDLQQLRPYWESQKATARMDPEWNGVKGVMDKLPKGDDAWKRFLAGVEREQGKKRAETVEQGRKDYLSMLGKEREKMRRQNPQMDELLVKHFGYTPVQEQDRKRLEELEKTAAAAIEDIVDAEIRVRAAATPGRQQQARESLEKAVERAEAAQELVDRQKRIISDPSLALSPPPLDTLLTSQGTTYFLKQALAESVYGKRSGEDPRVAREVDGFWEFLNKLTRAETRRRGRPSATWGQMPASQSVLKRGIFEVALSASREKGSGLLKPLPTPLPAPPRPPVSLPPVPAIGAR